MKVPNFPLPARGEAFSSVIARHLERSPVPRSKHIKALNLSSSGANTLVPNTLPAFASILPEGHPWENDPKMIVANHTLAPLFLHFAHPRRTCQVISAISKGTTKNSAASLGIATQISAKFGTGGKICPECMAQDTKALGYPVMYRHHQPSFVHVCAEHGCELFLNCEKCETSYRAASAWNMAGRCKCSSPASIPSLPSKIDQRTADGFVWLARQVSTILDSHDSHSDLPLSHVLLSLLKQNGFVSSRGGLDSFRINEALLAEFGEPFLSQIGLESWGALSAAGPRPSRSLSKDVIEGKRTPDVLKLLLLSRLVTEDIMDLHRSPAQSRESNSQVTAAGYGQRGPKNRERLSKAEIFSAIRSNLGKLTPAAATLGVNSYSLAADMRRLSIQLPLTRRMIERIGPEIVNSVRDDLSRGVPKSIIRKKNNISEWSLILVELDDPQLNKTHQNRTIENQREKHRDSLRKFIDKRENGTRSEYIEVHPGDYDWLRNNDHEWLYDNLPTQTRGLEQPGRTSRNDWNRRDLDAVSAIRRLVRSELESKEKPRRLSRSRLFSEATGTNGLSQRRAALLPLAFKESGDLSESRDEFLRRKIRWAVVEYSHHHTFISINQLRRVAGLAADTLKEFREDVLEVAMELDLPFHAKCGLAPWNQE